MRVIDQFKSELWFQFNPCLIVRIRKMRVLRILITSYRPLNNLFHDSLVETLGKYTVLTINVIYCQINPWYQKIIKQLVNTKLQLIKPCLNSPYSEMFFFNSHTNSKRMVLLFTKVMKKTEEQTLFVVFSPVNSNIYTEYIKYFLVFNVVNTKSIWRISESF